MPTSSSEGERAVNLAIQDLSMTSTFMFRHFGFFDFSKSYSTKNYFSKNIPDKKKMVSMKTSNPLMIKCDN